MSDPSFPGASTQWKSIPATNPGAWEQSVAAEADTLALDIAADIEKLREEAAALALEAKGYIDECANFTAEAVTVVYTPPTFANATHESTTYSPVQVSGAPGSVSVEISPYVPLGDASEYEGDESADNPDPFEDTVPTLPTLIGMPAAPAAPTGAPETDPGAVPGLTFTPHTPGSVTAPVPAEILMSATLEPVQAFVLETSLTDANLTDALDKLRSMTSEVYPIPEYQPIYDDVFTTVGAMLSGNAEWLTGLKADLTARGVLDSARYASAMSHLWDGTDAPDSITTYATFETQRRDGRRNLRLAGESSVWAHDLLVAGIRLGTAAHQVQMDIVMGLSNAEMSALMGTGEAMLSMAEAADAAYKGAISAMKVEVAKARAELMTKESEADAYLIGSSFEKTKASVNRTRSAVFATGESAKRGEVATAEAELSVDEARLDAYAAKMKALSAKAEAASLGRTEYQRRVAEWVGKLESLKQEYDIYTTHASKLKSLNRVAVANTRINMAGYGQISSDIKARLSAVQMNAAVIQKEVAEKTAALESSMANNALAGIQDKNAALGHAAQIDEVRGKLAAASTTLAGIEFENRQAITYFTSVAEAAARAAQLTQASNTQLAEAYRAAQDAAGRGGAAIESGRLGGWNASATIQASGSLSANSAYNRSLSTDYMSRVSEANSEELVMNYGS